MVAPGGCLFCDKATIRYLEPMLWAELRSLHPVPDLSQSCLHPSDHLARLVPEFLSNGVQTNRPPQVEYLEPSRAVHLPEHPGADTAARPHRLAEFSPPLLAGSRIDQGHQAARSHGNSVEKIPEVGQRPIALDVWGREEHVARKAAAVALQMFRAAA